MNPKERREFFYQRWNIGQGEYSEKEEIEKLKVRILNLLQGDLGNKLTFNGFFEMCQVFHIEMKETGIYYSGMKYEDSISRTILTKYFQNLSSQLEIYYFLEELFSKDFMNTFTKRKYIQGIKEIIDFSYLGVSIVVDDENILFYPKGEKILDEILVNGPLSFLSQDINEKFQTALNFYLQKNYIKSCEECRRVLEEFLREKLGNSKGLEQNIGELGRILKNHNSIVEIRNMICKDFSSIDKFFNENSKHNDGELQDFDNEYIIYQTGLFMRYIENFFQKNKI